jgi:regulation of enolase protein 1 (concanavalin A-like superfamily)
MSTISLSAIPTDLYWKVDPLDFSTDNKQSLTIAAGKQTDLFTSPGGDITIANSPCLVFPMTGDCLLSAKVEVGFKSTFDAGVLVLFVDENRWAKLCFEYSPQGNPMVVTVVTRGLSDDCNSTIIDGNQVYLRVARIGDTFVFHASTDGKTWNMIRYFSLGPVDEVILGFSAQSPTGEACTVTFTDIRFAAQTLENLRDGS